MFDFERDPVSMMSDLRQEAPPVDPLNSWDEMAGEVLGLPITDTTCDVSNPVSIMAHSYLCAIQQTSWSVFGDTTYLRHTRTVYLPALSGEAIRKAAETAFATIRSRLKNELVIKTTFRITRGDWRSPAVFVLTLYVHTVRP